MYDVLATMYDFLAAMYGVLATFFKNDLRLTAWATVVQATVSVVGFLFVLGQLKLVRLQLRLVRRNIRGTTQDSLYAHYTEVCKLFLDKPDLRPYFYDKKPKPISCLVDRPYLNEEIDAASEMILGLIEHAIMQRKNLPDDSWSHCWQPYAKERVEKSPTIQKFYTDNKRWYAQELQDQINQILGDAGG
jgi:hypothetical protein